MPQVNLPTDLRVPGVYSQVDNTGAVTQPVANQKRGLIVAYNEAAGTGAEGVPFLVEDENTAVPIAGPRSQAAQMCRAFKRANRLTELWCVTLDPPGAGVAASGAFVITGTATAAGTLQVKVHGELIEAAIASGDSATDAGDALEAALNAKITLLTSTSTNTAGSVAVTCAGAGTYGNDIALEVVSVPAGLSVAITAMASGASVPDAATAIAAIGDEQYGFIALGFSAADDTNLDLWDTELERRWGPTVGQIKGHAFVGVQGTLSAVTTLTAAPARNSPFMTLFDAGTLEGSPPWVWATNVAAVDAGEAHASLTRKTLVLSQVVAPSNANKRSFADRNTLLNNGCATHVVNASGQVAIERLITTYEQNSSGSPDPSYLDRETLGALQYGSETWQTFATSAYARTKIVDVGQNVEPGIPVIDVNDIQADVIEHYRQMISLGHFENLDAFKESLVVRRNAGDPSRVDIFRNDDVANNLLTIASLFSFRL